MSTPTARRLRNIARLLDGVPHIHRHSDCGCPTCRAQTWDTTGYPSSTLGNGIRSADRTSTTERHALTPTHLTYSYRYQAALASLDIASVHVHNLLVELGYNPAEPQAKATLDDHTPAGRGNCENCDVFVIGDGESNRLRSGLCHRCHSWRMRWRKNHPGTTVQDFIRAVSDNGYVGHTG